MGSSGLVGVHRAVMALLLRLGPAPRGGSPPDASGGPRTRIRAGTVPCFPPGPQRRVVRAASEPLRSAWRIVTRGFSSRGGYGPDRNHSRIEESRRRNCECRSSGARTQQVGACAYRSGQFRYPDAESDLLDPRAVGPAGQLSTMLPGPRMARRITGRTAGREGRHVPCESRHGSPRRRAPHDHGAVGTRGSDSQRCNRSHGNCQEESYEAIRAHHRRDRFLPRH